MKKKIDYSIIAIILMYIGLFVFVILNKYSNDLCIIGLILMVISVIIMNIRLIEELVKYFKEK